MTRERLGILIGATFGLVFVLVNAGGLPGAVRVPLWAAAGLAYAGLLVALARGYSPVPAGVRGSGPGTGSAATAAPAETAVSGPAPVSAAAGAGGGRPDGGPAPRMRFGRGYRLVVAAEVVAGYAGILLLNNVFDTPRASVAWIATVVGVHFLGLAKVWSIPSIGAMGAVMTALGVAGLVLAAAGAPGAAIATVGGVCPGVLLLGASWWALLRGTPREVEAV